MADKTVAALVRCPDYERAPLSAALERLFEETIKVRELVRPGMKILLKPNLLTGTPPERAVTTHPLVVELVAEKLSALGASVAIGDSPGASIHNFGEICEICGMTAAARRTGATLVSFDARRSCSHPAANPFLDRVQLSEAWREYDLIVNLPKLKTHTLTVYSGALKNLFGFVPGAVKAEVHRRAPKSAMMAVAVLAVHEHVKPAFTIMDAVVGHEGNGPIAGTPAPLGYLIGSRSCTAVDFAAVRLVGFDPRRVPTLAHLLAHGATEPEFAGDGLPPAPLPFRPPRSYPLNILPAFLLTRVSRLATLTPAFPAGKCTRCGTCVKACPVAALTLTDTGVVIDAAKCVSCLCCHELCTFEAVELRRSLLGKLMFRDTRGKK